MKTRTNHPLLSFAGITMLALFVLSVSGCGDSVQPGNTASKTGAPIKTALAVVKTTTHPIIYEAVGTVQPRTAATISAKVMGQVKAVNFHVGDPVKKGQKLVTIEGRQIQAKLDQARAGLMEAQQAEDAAKSALTSAKARNNLAEKTYQRYKALLESESVSRQEFDEVEAKYRQATAGLEQAKSMMGAAAERVKQAKSALDAAKSVWSDTIITAPYDGTVTAKMVDPGDMAAPGAPLLRLEEAGAYDVHLILPEAHIHSIAIGDTVSVHVEAVKESAITGKIRTIDPAADPSSLSFQVKVALPAIDGLRSGMFSRVSIPIGRAGMILIPNSAIVHFGELTGIFLVEHEGIARFRLIRTGRIFGAQAEVVSGLSGGETYVVQPPEALADGAKVEAAK